VEMNTTVGQTVCVTQQQRSSDGCLHIS